MSRRSRSLRAGTSTVEMALVLPLLLLLVFSGMEFGLAFSRWQTLSNAAREGARLGVVFRSPCDEPTVLAAVETTVENYAAGVFNAPPTVNVTGLCLGTGTTVQVIAQARHDFLVVPGLAGVGPNIDITASAVMRNE